MRIITRGLSIAAVVFATAIVGVVLDFSFRPRTTAITGPAPVARLEQVPLNGVPQWILIRGADTSKSILLFLHGGPGMPVMFLGHVFQRDLEKHFIVVHWDRRGAGKSFAAGENWQPSVSANLRDLHALAERLHRDYPGRKLILVGHSWGTYLGMLAIRDRPDLYDAYVGTGQMAADHNREVEARLTFFRHEAQQRGDKKMLARLARGEKPNEDDLFAYDAELAGARSYWPMLWWGARASEYTFQDVLNVPKGASRLEKKMRYDVISGPLDQNVLSVKVPVYFVLGRRDWNTPSTLAAQYFGRLQAPAKRLYWFEHAAHFPFVEDPVQFDAVMQDIDRNLPNR